MNFFSVGGKGRQRGRKEREWEWEGVYAYNTTQI
jgi:hypothetical protein